MSQKGFTLIELLVVIAIIGVLAGISFPAVQSIRETARLTNCRAQVGNIALATLAYNSSRRHFPPGINSPAHVQRPSLSWLGQIMPFVELDSLYSQSTVEFGIQKNPFLLPHATLQHCVSLFGCPSDPRSGSSQLTHEGKLVGLTSYLGVCGTSYKTKDGVFFQDSKTRTNEIRDGLSNTLLIGERPPSADNWYGWWYAGYGQAASGSPDMLLGASEENDGAKYCETCPHGPYFFSEGALDRQCDVFHFWSVHPSGSVFAHADGAVHFHSYDIDKDLLLFLATRAGGEIAAFED